VVLTTRTEVGKFLATFKKFPPRQRAASFSADQIIEDVEKPERYRSMITRRAGPQHAGQRC